MIRPATFAFFLILFAFSPIAHAAGDAWYGMKLNVEADGILHPVVHSIKVGKVWPESPAARAGLAVGDVMVEIEGLKVDGAKADELKKAMNKKVGETLRLKIQHDGKALRDCTLTAARKPEQ